MKEIIAVINQKGGVGKSTTAHALGAGLALDGARVLFVDLDAQGNLTYSLNAGGQLPSAMDVMEGESAESAIESMDKWDCVASSPSLSGSDKVLTATGKEYRLREALEPLASRYDYVIIDTPPALGILTVNALTAATVAVIPSQADIYSLQGIGQLHGTLEAIRRYTNPKLRVGGILLTRYSARAVLSRDIADMIQDTAQRLGTRLFDTRIRECVALKEAQAQREDIFTYAPKSNAAEDYAAWVVEFRKEIAQNA